MMLSRKQTYILCQGRKNCSSAGLKWAWQVFHIRLASVFAGDGAGPSAALIAAAFVVLEGTAWVNHWKFQLNGSRVGRAFISPTARAYFRRLICPFGLARFDRVTTVCASLGKDGRAAAPIPAALPATKRRRDNLVMALPSKMADRRRHFTAQQLTVQTTMRRDDPIARRAISLR